MVKILDKLFKLMREDAGVCEAAGSESLEERRKTATFRQAPNTSTGAKQRGTRRCASTHQVATQKCCMNIDHLTQLISTLRLCLYECVIEPQGVNPGAQSLIICST